MKEILKYIVKTGAELLAAPLFFVLIFLVARPWFYYMDANAGLMTIDNLERPLAPGGFTILFFLGAFAFLFFSVRTVFVWFYQEKPDYQSFTTDFYSLKAWQRIAIFFAFILLVLLVFCVMHWVLNT